MVKDVVSRAGMAIDGWQLRAGEAGRACPRCGARGRPLYQGQRYTPGGWTDLPDALLCDGCLQLRFDVQRVEHREPPRRPWWRRR
jgi:hypothetical protein